MFGKILEKEFGNPNYRLNSRWTTDAYAIRHYGKASVPQAVKSVNHHLIRLTFHFDYKMTVKQCDSAFRSLTQLKGNFKWMVPPENVGNITVADVMKAKSSQEHLKLVEEWAYEAWMAWKQHHLSIRYFIETHYLF